MIKIVKICLSIGIILPLFSCTANVPQKSQVHIINNIGNCVVIHLTSSARSAMGLEFAEAKERVLEFEVKTTGEVQANANLLTHVNAPVSGRVQTVFKSVGDQVEAGNPLLEIRSQDIEQAEADLLQNEGQVRADLKRDLLQADSDISQDKADIQLSFSIYQRMQNLVTEKIASRANLESAKTQYEKNRISLEADNRKRQATITLSEERMRLLTDPLKQKLRLLGVSESGIDRVLKTRQVDPVVTIVAPRSGLISERLINVGELIDSSKSLFTIGDFHNVWLEADIYEKDVSKVKQDQPIELVLDSFPGETFKGKLNYVADSINPDTRTLVVRAEVENPGLKLKPKMFAHMIIQVGEHQVLTIPKQAIQDSGSYKVVYVPFGPFDFQERHISLGNESGDYVEVLSGLKAGEEVVTKGSFDLMSESLKESG